MLIVRSPLRISLFGGGTDIDPFLTEYGGEVVSLTIAKYIYITIHPLIESSSIMLKYSKNEIVNDPLVIEHPVFREALKLYNLNSVDISVSSDIAAGTGLGSSSSFTVGLIHTLRAYMNMPVEKVSLAREACKIEIDLLGEPIGVQDQHACAIGGLNHFIFRGRSSVEIKPLFVTDQISNIFHRHCLLVRIPGSRSASQLLKGQNKSHNLHHLNKLKNFVGLGLEALHDSPERFGKVLDESWSVKKKLSSQISNSYVDGIYDDLISLGFFGGKLLGAGNSGYLLMVGPAKIVSKLKENNQVKTMSVELDSEGSKIIYTTNL